MSDLEYIFDKDQLMAKGQSSPETYVKGMFRELMKKPTEQQQIFDVIWGNVPLRGILFPATVNMDQTTLDANKESFKGTFSSMISSITNSFYNFIKAR